ncbi:hypothetical protein WJX75_005665 [Coccomyxa subellipsoidea]|uniref:Uncharacterized protein n=1 Tax=Coccomyxa subellipsoidea TaxID=248742 RepID=A0ABR2YLA5_9CHLO
MKEKHKDVLTDKVVVQDRANAEALFVKYQTMEDDILPMLILELARAVYKERVVDTSTGTISNLTKAQIWKVSNKGIDVIAARESSN